MVNLSKIKEYLEAGLISFSKAGDAYVVSGKRFDSNTGEELDPEIETLDIPDLEKKKSELLKAVSGLEFLISELKKLN